MRDNQQWIRNGLWQIRRQKLARGEVQLRKSDLFNIFPSLLGEGKVTCGADWPDGWTILIYNLLQNITIHNSEGDPESGTPIVIDQIKEKFGELRFYWQGGFSTRKAVTFYHWPTCAEIEGQVNLASSYSKYICCIDGSTTNIVQTKAWICFLNENNKTKKMKELGVETIPVGFSFDFTKPR